MSQNCSNTPIEEKKRQKNRIHRRQDPDRIISPPSEYEDNRSLQHEIIPAEIARAYEIPISEPIDDHLKARQYAYTKSHDILNHNQVAMGFMEMAMDHISPESDIHFMLSRAYNALRRSSILTQGVHSISRPGPRQCAESTGPDSTNP
ncbi:MAG TPA: hypothetical protein VK436_13770 [Methanocella sp.]|nr:hypothetical protein [Methanocella sp.]